MFDQVKHLGVSQHIEIGKKDHEKMVLNLKNFIIF